MLLKNWSAPTYTVMSYNYFGGNCISLLDRASKVMTGNGEREIQHRPSGRRTMNVAVDVFTPKQLDAHFSY